jgi:hypothetical protein
VPKEKQETKLERLLRRRRNKRRATFGSVFLLLLAGSFLAFRMGFLGPVDGGLPAAFLASLAPEAAPAPEPRPKQTPVDPAPVLEEAAPPPATGDRAAAPSSVLPELDESDAFVRRVVAALARHPELVRWLAGDDLVRRFVAVVDNVAEGRSPRPHLDFLEPPGPFLVVGDLDGPDPVVPDPINERRYDALVSAIGALDPGDCAKLYVALQPLLQEAYVDLGYPDESFDERLKLAAFELLNTPIVPARPQLVVQVQRFEYLDPALEDLSDAQKHLLRMGPRNVDQLQRKLRTIFLEVDPAWVSPAMQVYRSLPTSSEDE